MKSKIINSKSNPQIKAWRKLLTPKGRKKSHSYLIEGHHLLEEAIKSGAKVKCLIVTKSNLVLYEENQSDYEVTVIGDNLAKELSATEQSQGVFAEVSMPINRDELPQGGTHFLLIDAIQDPGNLGTIIRTADAANYDAIILGEGTVDLYNDKVIRATQGSLWHLPIIEMPLHKAINEIQSRQITIYATALHQKARSYKDVNVDNKGLGLIVGNEGQGVQQTLIDQADLSIYIPMPGSAESLNVSVASGILLFEFVNMNENQS